MEDFKVVGHFFERLFDQPIVKGITAGIFFILNVAFGPFRPIYGAVICLVVVDTITGYACAWLDPDTKPSSRRMYHGLVKMLVYAGLLCVAYQLGKAGEVVVKSILEAGIAATEGKSVLENIKRMYLIKEKPVPPIIESALRLLEGKAKKLDSFMGGGQDANHKHFKRTEEAPSQAVQTEEIESD